MTGEPQDALLRAAETGADAAALAAPDAALLEYATKLTLTPGEIERDDVDRLRAAGFDDRAIHDVCAIASYYAFVNRIADGLGVELEPGRDPAEGDAVSGTADAGAPSDG